MEKNKALVPTLYCFDQDFRLDDNPAFDVAAMSASQLLCVYCHDSSREVAERFGTRRLGPIRKTFIEQSLVQLSSNLRQAGQALLQVSGSPVAILGGLIDEHRIQRVVRSRHFGVFENRQWEQLRQTYPTIDFIEIDGYTLFTSDQVERIGELPETFSKFRRHAERLAVNSPAEQGRPLPPPIVSNVDLSADEIAVRPKPQFLGGEDAATSQLDSYFKSQSPSSYKQTRNALDGWPNSSKMSPWLATGCLSVRRLYQRIKQYEAIHGANDSTYWLYFELLWREYFQWYAQRHAERLFLAGGITGDNPDYDFDIVRFESWCLGETRWPLVNACMRQLNQTGYLSNRARQIVASALINELRLDWRCGAGYFEQQLIDYDVASNWGNWQYIAGVGADPRGGRHFSIEKQARQFDADGRFVAKWLNPCRQEAAGEAGATTGG